MASNWNQPQAPPGYPAIGGGQPAAPQGYPDDRKQGEQQEAYGGGWGQQPAGAASGQPYGAAAYPGAGAPPPMMPMGMPMSMPMAQMAHVDPESQQMNTDMAFATTQMRNAFVRKVFGIVTLQLLITVAVAATCMYVPEVKLFVTRNRGMYYAAWGIAFAIVLVISCFEKARRSFPTNAILLTVFTLAEAYLVGMITAFHNVEAVMLAFLVTCAAVAALTIFAMNTKIDVTKWGSMLMVVLVVLLVLVLLGIFWKSKTLYLAIAGIAAILFSAYLVYDIQLIMGGKTYSYSPDDYIAAALAVYLDVINLFLAILSIIGLTSNN